MKKQKTSDIERIVELKKELDILEQDYNYHSETQRNFYEKHWERTNLQAYRILIEITEKRCEEVKELIDRYNQIVAELIVKVENE